MGASDDSTDYYEIIKNSIDRSKYTVLKGGIYPYKVVSVLMDKFVISSTRSEYVEIYGFLIKTKGSYYIVPHPIIDPKEGYEVVFERDLWPVIKDNLYKYVKINGRVISRRGKRIHGLIYRGRKAIWAVHIEEAKPPVPKVLSEKDYMDIILDGIELYKAYRGINELYASWFACLLYTSPSPRDRG